MTNPTRFREGQKPTMDDLVFVNEESLISDIEYGDPFRAPHDAQNACRSRTRMLFHSLESCFVRGLHPLKLQPGGGFSL